MKEKKHKFPDKHKRPKPPEEFWDTTKVLLIIFCSVFLMGFVSASSDFNMSKYTEAASSAFTNIGSIAGFFSGLSFSGGELIGIVFAASIVIGIIVFIFMRILSKPK